MDPRLNQISAKCQGDSWRSTYTPHTTKLGTRIMDFPDAQSKITISLGSPSDRAAHPDCGVGPGLQNEFTASLYEDFYRNSKVYMQCARMLKGYHHGTRSR